MKVLFYLAHTYSIPVVLPLVRQLHLDTKNQVRMYCSDKVAHAVTENAIFPTRLHTLKEVLAFEPAVVLCPGNYLDPRFPGLKVQLFHGVGIEKPSHYVIRDFFDYYFTSGSLVTERFRALERAHGHFEVLETGWPKFDHILHYESVH